jgi:predicted amidohydrolase
MRVALVQSSPEFGEVERNLEQLKDLVTSVSAELYVLPELCLTGYDFMDRAEVEDCAETVDGPAVSALCRIAADRGAAIVFGFAEAAPGGPYNSALLALPEGRRRVYRKTHLFSREKLCFSPGDTGFFVEEFRGLRIGPAICFDWIFPESFRSLALRGADLIAHSANLVLPFCQRADFARAVENRVFVATANRVGSEQRSGGRLDFTGGSVLVSPQGEYLASLPPDEIAVAVIDIDPARARDKHITPCNDLFEDRRPEFYER